MPAEEVAWRLVSTHVWEEYWTMPTEHTRIVVDRGGVRSALARASTGPVQVNSPGLARTHCVIVVAGRPVIRGTTSMAAGPGS